MRAKALKTVRSAPLFTRSLGDMAGVREADRAPATSIDPG